MKTRLCFILTLLTFVMLAFVPYSFAQGDSPEYVVRVIYFHPNDIEPQEGFPTTLSSLVKDVQKFYADEMERHGFGRKTFRLETDETGDVVVHHLKGEFTNAHYTRWGAEYDEVRKQLDASKKVIYLILSDIRDENPLEFYGHKTFPLANYGSGLSPGGDALGNYVFIRGVNRGVETRYVYPRAAGTIAHELGHAFGLLHDFRDNRYIMSYGPDPVINQFSPCAAKWLDANRYFNATQIVSDQFRTNIEMFPPSFVSRPNTIRLRFRVTDFDGFHQAVLLTNTVDTRVVGVEGVEVLDCKDLNGNDTTIEFVTTDLLSRSTNVTLRVIDVYGNFTTRNFPIDITPLLPHSEVVSIPDTTLAASIRENLGLAFGDTITRLDMLELRVLIVERGQITDLTGIQHATKLEHLEISENKISDLTPLKGLTQLRFLAINRNPITDVGPLTGLIQLESLDISDCKISDITPLAKLTSLAILDLGSNQIADIRPLNGLINLSELSLRYNKIGDKSLTLLTELPKLEVLSLAGNQIHDIAFLTELAKLSGLNLSRNQIVDITPLKGLTNLHRLGLSHNQISNVSPLTGLTYLHILVLAHNQISDVSPLGELTSLGLLNLEGNPIKNRKPLFELLEKNPDVKIYLKDGGEPLPVTLSHFRAEHTDAGVLLKWTTESEVDNAGFFIYRSETKEGEFKVVNPTMIQGAGTTGERNEYTWTDTSTKPNIVYYYRIEDVSHAGDRKQLATVRLRGLVSAKGKLTIRWADLKAEN